MQRDTRGSRTQRQDRAKRKQETESPQWKPVLSVVQATSRWGFFVCFCFYDSPSRLIQ